MKRTATRFALLPLLAALLALALMACTATEVEPGAAPAESSAPAGSESAAPASTDGEDDGDEDIANESEFTGTVESIDGNTWTVNGQQVAVAGAELEGDIAVGDMVKVHASQNDDGVWVAREIELADDDDDDDGDDDGDHENESEWTGAVDAISGDTWTIGGVQVMVTAGTEIEGNIAVGDVVKVHASQNDDGVWVAREIELADDDDDDDGDDDGDHENESEWTGAVDAISGDTWTIGGVQVMVTASTEIEGNIAVGDVVKVEASQNDDGVWVAREIELADDDDDDGDDHEDDDVASESEWTGTVDAISGDTWTVGGIQVMVTGETEVKGDIVVGDMVKVEASQNDDGVWIAREIELADDDDDDDGDDHEDDDVASESEWTGTVDAISGDTWTIGGVQVMVTGETEVKGDIAVGDMVKVEASQNDDGVWVAQEIELVDDDEDDDDDEDHEAESEWTGTVDAISGDTWTVGGIQVMVTGETEVKGDIAVGDVVKVEASQNDDGVWVAREIELADDDHVGDDDDEDEDIGDDDGDDHGDDDGDDHGDDDGDDHGDDDDDDHGDDDGDDDHGDDDGDDDHGDDDGDDDDVDDDDVDDDDVDDDDVDDDDEDDDDEDDDDDDDDDD